MDPWSSITSEGYKKKKNIRRIKAIYQQIIMNELGIRNGLYMNIAPKVFTATPVPGGERGLIDYQPIDLMNLPRGEELYTEFGGYLPITIKEVGFTNGHSESRLLKVNPAAPLYRRCGMNFQQNVKLDKLSDRLIEQYQERGYEIDSKQATAYLPSDMNDRGVISNGNRKRKTSGLQAPKSPRIPQRHQTPKTPMPLRMASPSPQSPQLSARRMTRSQTTKLKEESNQSTTPRI